jgi:hypothetical protein
MVPTHGCYTTTDYSRCCINVLTERAGIWLFLIGKVLFFALPALAGVDVMGLMTPIFFIESATFFILFGKRIKYMN